MSSFSRRGRRRRLCISSGDESVGAPGLADYCAAKAGIFGLVRTVAREVAQAGVQVSTGRYSRAIVAMSSLNSSTMACVNVGRVSEIAAT